MHTLELLLRVLHIGFAATVIGAAIFQYFAVLPSLRTLPDAQRSELRESLASRWRPWVFAAIAVLLITGLLNFVLFKVPAYRGAPNAGMYHMLFGLKLLLALAVFHQATMLVLSGRSGEKRREMPAGTFQVLLGLYAAIVVVAGVMRYFPQFFQGR
ncbi:MAG: hypothetical protein U1D55_14975 [Phycisphaerae bacterium]